MKKIIIAIISICFFLLFVSCNKNISDEEAGIVKDYTGLDGCGLVIVLDNGKNLEPVSMPAGITLIPDRRIQVKYRVVERASICMVGYTAEIISLRYL